ncbi:innate immunity activator b isoform X2 [Nematolebias whitei]|uniref:innate immunity activator b isoform X2 n=1 Tax=Nematolebias whitei TaxID=451745 RepID=UPI0018996BED|nr:innate immunity activator b isoform X2 [Nematolebias whitei]
MEGTGEISDTDSGIILHSGSDSPTTHTKDVTTHTRAMKIKHQALQDQLEMCLLELKKLCIREAELTGKLPKDYPLLPGEKPPQIRRRIGAAFKLEEPNIPERSEDSELCLVDAELALQMKIYEAARKLCQEDHLSKAVRKSRLQQCKVEEKKVKKLQEKVFQLRLERGRSSPLPAFNITQDLGTSDDSSLSDSVVQDEVASQSSQRSLGLLYPVETDPPQPLLLSTRSSVDGSYMSHTAAPQSPLLNSCRSPCPSLDSKSSLNSSPAYDPPPIQHSPWAESSLDQPYQKSKKSHSSSKTSTPTKSELLPPLEVCILQTSLPQQLSHLRLSRAQSNSTPSTPEMRVRRQLSLRLSNHDSSVPKDRGRPRGPRRRLTEFGITLPDAHSPTMSFVNHVSSEDSSSEKSFSSYSSSPCQEFPSNLPHQYQSGFPVSSPDGNYGPQALLSSSFHHNPRYMFCPGVQKTYYNEEMVYLPEVDMTRSRFSQQTPRYDYCYREASVPLQRVQRPLPPEIRVTPPAHMDYPQYRSNGLPRQVVNEQLKSWHLRSQFKAPRSRSLDRQGAVRVKSGSFREAALYQNQTYHEQGIQRGTFQRAAEDTHEPWLIDDGTHYISQV